GDSVWRVRAAGLADGPGGGGRPCRAVRGDDRGRQGSGRSGSLGLYLALRPLPHRARADDGDDLRVLDGHRHPGSRHAAGQDRADGRLQRVSAPGPVREDRLDGRRGEPRPIVCRVRRRLVRARVAGVRDGRRRNGGHRAHGPRRIPRGPRADGDVPGGGRGRPPDVDRGHAELPGAALRDRRPDQRAEERQGNAGREDSVVDRGRRREGHAAAGGPVRRRLQRRRRCGRDGAPEARDPEAALRRRRARLRRDRKIDQRQRVPARKRGGHGAGDGAGPGQPTAGGVLEAVLGGDGGPTCGADAAAGGGRRRLHHRLHAAAGIRLLAGRAVRAGGDPAGGV
ncbi:MAG: luciferase-like protein, partial [uncultured Thermomicrobiales bacterium]